MQKERKYFIFIMINCLSELFRPDGERNERGIFK
nr:MAG TPA: hypothetical protein [Caudoviricetes sp.]DAW90827.1 MAG TPA: hypothetical protein [Caudoviricetes sp.]